MLTTDLPIIIEIDFKTTVEKVWKALTELEQMKQWYFEQLVDFKAEAGFKTQFSLQHEGRTFTHKWKILEVIPLEKISYNWSYQEYPGSSTVTFSLNETTMGTHLHFKAIILEDFPQDIHAFKRESGLAGWNYLIGESLQKFLEDSTSLSKQKSS